MNEKTTGRQVLGSDRSGLPRTVAAGLVLLGATLANTATATITCLPFVRGAGTATVSATTDNTMTGANWSLNPAVNCTWLGCTVPPTGTSFCTFGKASGYTGSCTVSVIFADTGSTNFKTCDPVFTTLRIDTGHWVRQTFTAIPYAEHYVSVTNGTPGLQKMDVRVNGRLFATVPLGKRNEASLDLAPAMNPTEPNTITLVGAGKLGASAEVSIQDTAPAVAPKPARPAGRAAKHHAQDDNGVWGPLAEESEDTGDLHSVDLAAQQVSVYFTGGVDTFAAGDRGIYTVKVNGKERDLVAATAVEDPNGVKVTLQLAPRTLKEGDAVDVYWDGLKDTAGQPLSGHAALSVPRSH